MSKICSVEGCGRKHWGKGLCRYHYNRTPECRENGQSPTRKKSKRKSNLAMYGITEGEYESILRMQGGHCGFPDCEGAPKTRRLHVDHEHRLGFKHLPPEEKRKYVRGLLCYRHNSHIVASNTLDSAKKVVYYLEQFEARKKCSGL